MNRRRVEISAIFGLICFVSGTLFYLIKHRFSAYVAVNLVLGAGLLGVALFFNLKEIVALFRTSGQKGAKNILARTGFVLGVVVFVNLLSNIFYTGFDLTKEKVSSISEQTRKVVKWLKEPLEIIVFETSKIKDFERFLLESYNFANKRITFSFEDPEKNPQKAQEYGIDRSGQAVVKYKNGFLRVNQASEEEITNAILRLTQKDKNTIYFTLGHGEHELSDVKSTRGYGLLWKDLDMENYTVGHLKFEPPHYYMPANCTLLVVGGPKKAFTKDEIHAVKEYLENNGRAIFLLDPRVDSGLEDLIQEWGILADSDCLIDVALPSLVERAQARLARRPAGGRPVFEVMVNRFPPQEITADLQGKSLVLPIARSVSEIKSEKSFPDYVVEPLALTTEQGWGETDLDLLFNKQFAMRSEQETRGPKTVAFLSTKGKPESNSKIVVLGDSDFVTNEYIHQLYNRDFFLNICAFLTRQSTLISVRSRHLFATRLDVNPQTMTTIFTFSVLVIPQLFLMAGLAIWWLRR